MERFSKCERPCEQPEEVERPITKADLKAFQEMVKGMFEKLEKRID
jgi:hypothetical protein